MTVDLETTRRDMLRTAGAGSIALLALAGMHGGIVAQEATPLAEASLAGMYAVVRIRKVKPEFSVTELAQDVGEGFVPIVREVPGFVSYFLVADEEQRTLVAISIFTDKAGADESTERAAVFGQQGADDWIEGDPVIVESPIDIAAP